MIILFLSVTVLWLGLTSTAWAEINKEKILPKISRTIPIYIDGQAAPLKFSAFIDDRGISYISLSDCMSTLDAQIEITDNIIMITKRSQEFMLEAGDYINIPLKRLQAISEEFLPLDQIYLPLSFVARQLNYEIDYNNKTQAIIIHSFNYEGPDPELTFNLPDWGSLSAYPEIKVLWPGEDLIAGYFTNLSGSPAERNENVRLSCEKINGTIVASGEIFSFNNILGERTATAGYHYAPIIIDKKVFPGVGGGICQTSTTLYNCILESQLQVVERHPHTISVSYIPLDQDATVSWGGADFKFKNTLSNPIKVLAQIYNGYVMVAIASKEYK